MIATPVAFAAIWDFAAQPRERLWRCNICTGRKGALSFVPTRDRYGYEVEDCTCLHCGLRFLNPRMTAEAYARFYESGAYRRLVSAYHGREINAETIQDEQLCYSVALASFLRPHIAGEVRSLLDVGGSTGVVAHNLKELLGLESAVVLDPAGAETACASGMEVLDYPVERLVTTRTWDLITLCQTVDHLLDISGTLRKLHACLSENGLLFVDIVDFDETREIKIDHPFNLTEKTMSAFLTKAGFREVARERAPDGVHVRFLCAR